MDDNRSKASMRPWGVLGGACLALGVGLLAVTFAAPTVVDAESITRRPYGAADVLETDAKLRRWQSFAALGLLTLGGAGVGAAMARH